MKKITNSSSDIEFIPYQEAYSDGFEDMKRRIPDTKKIEQFTGWKSTVSLEETINRVWSFLS